MPPTRRPLKRSETIDTPNAMGEWERKSESKPHTQRTDKANVAEGGKITASTEDVFVICVKISDAVRVPYGSVVHLIDRKHRRVTVYLGPQLVGEVREEDSDLLRSRFGIAARSGRSIEGINVTATDGPTFNVLLRL